MSDAGRLSSCGIYPESETKSPKIENRRCLSVITRSSMKKTRKRSENVKVPIWYTNSTLIGKLCVNALSSCHRLIVFRTNRVDCAAWTYLEDCVARPRSHATEFKKTMLLSTRRWYSFFHFPPLGSSRKIHCHEEENSSLFESNLL